MLQRGKQIVGGILLLIFMAYYVNISFFTHSHIINGVTIVHSHFHDKAHAQSGKHTDSEVTLISMLSALETCAVATFFAGLAVFFPFATVTPVLRGVQFTTNRIVCVSLRAPPFHSF